MFSHKAIALDGVGFGHKALASFGLFGIQITIESRPVGYGGGSGDANLYLVIRMNFYGKLIRKTYALTLFDIAVKFVSKLLDVPMNIKAKFVGMKNIDRNLSINSIQSVETNKIINVDVDKSDLKITVKRK